MARGRVHRLLRADRARGRLRPGRPADPRRARRRRVGAQRQQDVDHQRHDRRRGGGLGEDRRRRARVGARLPGREGHARLHRAGDSGKVLAPRLVHRRAVASPTCGCPERNVLPGVQGLHGPLVLPQQRARRHRLRGDRGGDRLLRGGARRTRWSGVQFDRPIGVVPAHPGEAGRHAGAHRPGAAARAAAAPAQGRGAGEPGAGVAGKAEQRPVGAGDRALGAEHLRRQRHHRRLPAAPPHAEPRVGATPTRARTRCTRWCSARPSPASTPSGDAVASTLVEVKGLFRDDVLLELEAIAAPRH